MLQLLSTMILKLKTSLRIFSINANKYVGSYVPVCSIGIVQRHHINYKEAIKKFTEILAFV